MLIYKKILPFLNLMLSLICLDNNHKIAWNDLFLKKRSGVNVFG